MSKNYRNISLDLKQCCDSQKLIRNDLNHETKNKKDIARRRWGILAKALKSPISSQPSSPTDEISMRRFSTFELLRTQLIHEETITKDHLPPSPSTEIYEYQISPSKNRRVQYKKQYWYRYSTQLENVDYFVDIGHVSRSFTAADLIGFNNTGNVCVWPSEESLAYYILNNLNVFQDKTVLELGAGMSALAGLIVAKYGRAKSVFLTDGNALAVENVTRTLARNNFENCIVESAILEWGTEFKIYDVILSADCLFFDDARSDLIQTMWNCLDFNGIAYVMAPKRGETLDLFVQAAVLNGFQVDKLVFYDQTVWNRHLECLDNSDYNENIHYPILLILKKSS